MDVESAVREVLALPPTATGQSNYQRFHFGMLLMSGAHDPPLSHRLHHRAHALVSFAEQHSAEQLIDPSPKVQAEIKELLEHFPTFKSLQALDDLCLGIFYGWVQHLMEPDLYPKYFAPDVEFRFLGMMASAKHFHPTPGFRKSEQELNAYLMSILGPAGNAIEPFAEFDPVFFAELAFRVLGGKSAVRAHRVEIRRQAGLSRKPRQRSGGEAAKAARALYSQHYGYLTFPNHVMFIEKITGNRIASPADYEDESHKARALAAKYRSRLISSRCSGPIRNLNNSSFFTTYVIPCLFTEECQIELHEMRMNELHKKSFGQRL